MKILITITKDVIDRSLMCGTGLQSGFTVTNCALSVAYNDLIPHVAICGLWVDFMEGALGNKPMYKTLATCDTTQKQRDFIVEFDLLAMRPHLRYDLVGRCFEVEIPDSVIEYWYQDYAIAAQKIIDSCCLSLVKE